MREDVSADRLRYKFFGPTEDFLGPQAELSVAATFEEAPSNFYVTLPSAPVSEGR
jgi:hypothetical protein